MGKKKYGFTCCKCKRVWTGENDLPAISNITPGFDRCEECYKKEYRRQKNG